MKPLFRKNQAIYFFGIWGLLIIWYFVFGYQMLHKVDRALNDIIESHSFWMFSQQPKESDVITIVAIDQESRRRLNLKWPWPRSITGEMIHKISACGPKTIGLDIVFSGKSEPAEDRALIAALRAHPKIIAASVVQTDEVMKPAPQFERVLKSTGFVNRPIEDGKVRSIIPVIPKADQSWLLPMELELLQAYQGNEIRPQITSAGNEIQLNEQLNVKLENGLIPLNLLVYHSNFKIVPAYKVLEDRIDPADFKNKIVLIGATDPIIHDEYDTVLGIFPGVTIIANALVMLLSKRFIAVLPLYQIVLIGLICSGFIYRFCSKNGLLTSTLILLVMMALTFLSSIYLRSLDIRFSCLTLLFMQSATYLAFNIYHYVSLTYVRKKITQKALFDSASGLYSTRYFKLLAQEKCEQSDALAVTGIKITNYGNLIRQLTVDQANDLVRKIGSGLQNEVFSSKKEVMACVSPGVIGVIAENKKNDRLTLDLENFIDGTTRKKWEVGDCSVQVSLKGLLLQKAVGEKIENSDLISQMSLAFDKLDGDRKVYDGPIKDFDDNKHESKIRVRNEYDFIVHDWEEKAKDLANSLSAVSEANDLLDRLNVGIIKALARTIDANSAWTAGHSERVSHVSVQIARTMGLDDAGMKRLQIGSLLHDIGKIGIPAHILDKPGKLTDQEYDIICEHPAKGALILEPLEQLNDVIPLISQHHERFDGKGYPLGLAGNDIDPRARIVAVADVFDALRSDRPYRSGMPLEKVISIIKEGSGTQFDPDVVAVFFQFITTNRKKNPRFSTDRFVTTQSEALNEAAD